MPVKCSKNSLLSFSADPLALCCCVRVDSQPWKWFVDGGLEYLPDLQPNDTKSQPVTLDCQLLSDIWRRQALLLISLDGLLVL